MSHSPGNVNQTSWSIRSIHCVHFCFRESWFSASYMSAAKVVSTRTTWYQTCQDLPYVHLLERTHHANSANITHPLHPPDTGALFGIAATTRFRKFLTIKMSGSPGTFVSFIKHHGHSFHTLSPIFFFHSKILVKPFVRTSHPIQVL